MSVFLGVADVWAVPSSRHPLRPPYAVLRFRGGDNRWWCSCPATGTCRHIRRKQKELEAEGRDMLAPVVSIRREEQ